MADADPRGVPSYAAVAADPPDFEVSGIFDPWEVAWKGMPGRLIHRCGRLLSQGFVGTLVVVSLAEVIEPVLLSLLVRCGRPKGLRLQGSMHPLVAAVLLRMSRLDQLGEDPQANPPDGKPREAPDGGGREWRSVVGADDLGEPVLPEEALEGRLGELVGRRQKRADVEQVAGEAVRDGQRIAIEAVSGLEVALVVGGPDLVGGGHRRCGPSWVIETPALPDRRDEAMPLEDVADGGARGQAQSRELFGEEP